MNAVITFFPSYVAQQSNSGGFSRLFLSMCQPAVVTELDGTVSGDFFTVLCVGQGFTDDQWMNVYTFSMLRHWLLTYHSVSNGTADAGTSTCSRAANRRRRGLVEFEDQWERTSQWAQACLFSWTLLSFSSPPANRLQLSLSHSHSFSNGKTWPWENSARSAQARRLTPACCHRLTPSEKSESAFR